MGEYFFQALKWFISVGFIIGGIAAMNIAEQRAITEPIILAVFSFGAAYIMSSSWRKLNGKAIVISIVYVLACAYGARYVPSIMRVYAGIRIHHIDYYFIWLGLVFFPGIPFMMLMFSRFRN